MVFAVRYDDESNFVDCDIFELGPNELEDWDIEDDFDAEEGVIKVVSFEPIRSSRSYSSYYGSRYDANRLTVKSGVAAWIRHKFEDEEDDDELESLGDTSLLPLPVSLLTARSNYELNEIVWQVVENCQDD